MVLVAQRLDNQVVVRIQRYCYYICVLIKYRHADCCMQNLQERILCKT